MINEEAISAKCFVSCSDWGLYEIPVKPKYEQIACLTLKWNKVLKVKFDYKIRQKKHTDEHMHKESYMCKCIPWE